jgi:hypothetical protein
MSGPGIVINLTIIGDGAVNIQSSIWTITHVGPGSFTDSIGAPTSGAQFTAIPGTTPFNQWTDDLVTTSETPYVTWSTLGYPGVTTFNITAVFGAAVPPPMDRRRRYWPSQTERADAKRICQCPDPDEPARFASSADRLRALKARFVGCCCTRETARLYADVPRVQGGLPCSVVE